MMTEINNLTELRNHLQGLKAVVFDLDDTLYGEKEYVRSGYKAIANFLPQVERMEEKLWDAFLQKKPAIDEVLKAEGLYTEDRKQKCLSVYRDHEPDIHFYDGAKELLQFLRTNGFKLGVVTDGRPKGQRAKIKALKLHEFVDRIIVTDELGGVEYRKPNKTAFVKMQEAFGVAYEEMCYVGDNVNKDFIAPDTLGMRSILFKNKRGLYYR